ncbi:MAG: dihydroorotase [Balneolales bacterium]|nr:dihydroorotase [Balneolales bacterium]
MLQPNVLFINVQLADASGVRDYNTVNSLRIRDGKIAETGLNLSPENGEQLIDGKGAFLSPGWMDMHVHLREPGLEHKETIKSGCAAAAAGGFTAVACMPNTKPAIHTRDVVEYIVNRSASLPVEVHPIGCVSKDRKGESLAEMADMKEGGAVAFSDDGDPVYNARLMRTALEYAAMLDMPVINHEEDLDLSRPGHMHEGRVSTRLGLAGTPSIAEEVMIARDILLAELTGGHVHVAHISTRRGVEMVREAKAKGIRVTTEVCPHHFDLTDEEVERSEFDTNFKMHPPLRTADDVEAMIAGLADGTIDAICTDHAPHSVEEKEVEFIYAPNGILGLQTAWSVVVKQLLDTGRMSLPQVLRTLIDAPRTILRLPVPGLDAGQPANLTLFDTSTKWTYTAVVNKSKSRNSPYLNQTLKGAALGIYNRSQWVPNEAVLS